jgi:protein TonB
MGAIPPSVHPPLRRFGPLATIVLGHVAVFYAIQSGMWRQVAQAVPQEVMVGLIVPAPAQKVELPRPAPASAAKPAPKKAADVKTVATSQAPTALSTPAAAPASTAADSATAPAAPQAAAAPAIPKTVSGVEYIQAPQPEYPPLARRANEQGKVMLKVLVNERGRPEQVDVAQSSGWPRLDEAARQAALRALFKPHLEDGKPIAVYAMVPINFSI